MLTGANEKGSVCNAVVWKFLRRLATVSDGFNRQADDNRQHAHALRARHRTARNQRNADRHVLQLDRERSRQKNIAIYRPLTGTWKRDLFYHAVIYIVVVFICQRIDLSGSAITIALD